MLFSYSEHVPALDFFQHKNLLLLVITLLWIEGEVIGSYTDTG